MDFIKKFFRRKTRKQLDRIDFWTWFEDNANTFFKVVKEQQEIKENFFDRLAPQLDHLREGIFYLVGMKEENKAELILTPDGNIKNIVFIEDLVSRSPKIDNWLFTALKPGSNMDGYNIEMAGHNFGTDNLWFYSNDDPNYPDEVGITILHKELTPENEDLIAKGTYIFLDNYLGELEFITTIDQLDFIGLDKAEKELVPINKLKKYIIWREKEFIEKYEGIRIDTDNDSYSLFEFESNDQPIIAVMNTELLNWEKKASHPWILIITMNYDGQDNNGMPNKNCSNLMDKIEEEIMEQLKDSEGYINVGRETGNKERLVYFACKEFRTPSRTLYKVIEKYKGDQNIDFDIYKDKYWKTFNAYAQN